MYSFNKEDYMKRMEWYTQARFGMFLQLGAVFHSRKRGMDAQL